MHDFISFYVIQILQLEASVTVREGNFLSKQNETFRNETKDDSPLYLDQRKSISHLNSIQN